MINTENLATQPVGDIVSENYHSAGVFKEFGIDFCCGGGKPLNEVCEKNGLSLDEVIQKLNAIPWKGSDNSHNYKEWDSSFLIDYIINTHHQYVRKKPMRSQFMPKKLLVFTEKVILKTLKFLKHL